jgi:lysophospholipase L1-like esterase
MVERRFGVPFGVVLLPSHHQIHPASFQRYLKHMGLAGQDLDALRALDALAGALRARGVATLDTLPALRAAKVKRLTFPDDGHLVAAGHAIVAEALARWLDTGMGSGRPIAKAP